jgi:flagellar biosynthesis/type III secretory pathway ATPase
MAREHKLTSGFISFVIERIKKTTLMNSFANEIARIERLCSPALIGQVTDVTGLTVTVSGLPAPVGSMCIIKQTNGQAVGAQIVGFKDDRSVLMPLEDMLG